MDFFLEEESLSKIVARMRRCKSDSELYHGCLYEDDLSQEEITTKRDDKDLSKMKIGDGDVENTPSEVETELGLGDDAVGTFYQHIPNTSPRDTASVDKKEHEDMHALIDDIARLQKENEDLRAQSRSCVPDVKSGSEAPGPLAYMPTQMVYQFVGIPVLNATQPPATCSMEGHREGLPKEFKPGQRRKKCQAGRQALGDNVEGHTTVMLGGLPSNYTRSTFLEMLDEEGFHGQYDFVYMPFDFETHAALGYAFVNLTDPDLVPPFWKTFDGYAKWRIPSKKVLTVSWSRPNQGLDANVNRFRNSTVMHESVPDEFKPIILKGGVRMAFPTKAPHELSQPHRVRQRYGRPPLRSSLFNTK